VLKLFARPLLAAAGSLAATWLLLVVLRSLNII
jgi:hypothetical protein